jgi:type II secretory pathway pseudopilin PulG
MRYKFEIISTFIGTALLASIAVPNLLEARNRSRQKQTMADMRTIATAWEARATDLNSYTVDPDPRDSAAQDQSDFSKLHRVRAADLRRALEPKYIKKLPSRDGWGNEIEFRTWDYRGNGEAQNYVLRSLGSDHIAEAHTEGIITKFEGDIVFSNGVFLRYPERS